MMTEKTFTNNPEDLPVVIAAGTISQQDKNVAGLDEPWVLMKKAIEKAVSDIAAPQVVAAIDSISIPQGFWSYLDPGRLIADALGCNKAKTCLGSIGISQAAHFNRAAKQLLNGEAEVAVIVGGEAKYRSLQGMIQNIETPDTQQENVEPDYNWQFDDVLWSDLEQKRGLVMPTEFYALMESSLCAEQGHGIEEHRQYLGEFYKRFSEVAQNNEYAWFKENYSAEEIWQASDKNAMLSFPYTKRMNSQWNVNQAAAIIMTTVKRARELGVDEKYWVYPWAMAESSHVVCLSERPVLHRHGGTQACAEAVFEASGISANDIDHVDLYSCFPSAVQSHALDIGLPLDRQLTETGGMAFGGGPLNNFVMMSTAKMIEVLRGDQDKIGLVSTVCGINTKQGVAVFSTRPCSNGFTVADATARAKEIMPPVPSIENYSGEASLIASTVVFKKGDKTHGFVIAENPDGERLVCTTSDIGQMEQLTKRACNGDVINVNEDGSFTFREA